MTDKHFHAVLAKNAIAEEIRDGEATGELGMVKVSSYVIHSALKAIERYIGEGNQPSVSSIIKGGL